MTNACIRWLATHGLLRNNLLYSCYSQPYRIITHANNRLYTDKHEWVTIEKGKGTVGISEYAQEQLGEIVFVELPEVGAKLEPHDVAGCLESVKAASEVYSPVGGTVTEVNKRLSGEPKLVNSAPLTDGWLYKLDLGPNTKSEDLLDEKAYKALIGSLDTN